MITKRDNLPTEILDALFAFIRNSAPDFEIAARHLVQCQLTCKSWRAPAQRALLSQVRLTSDKAAKKLVEIISTSDFFIGS
jgi:hypothetical protein